MSQTEAMCQPDSALAEKVIAVLADKLGKPARTIHLDDDLLIDLGVDSLNMAEMTVLVEQVGGVRIPETPCSTPAPWATWSFCSHAIPCLIRGGIRAAVT